MKQEKRITYIDGLKLGYKNGVDLLNLINEQIKHHSKSDVKPEINLIGIANSIHKYLSQWENVQLGDKVEYKPQIIVMKNLFENTKPEPEEKTEHRENKATNFIDSLNHLYGYNMVAVSQFRLHQISCSGRLGKC